MARAKKFLWCPVCMVHTYHDRGKKGWVCLNEGHQRLLKNRRDPWIEKYKQEKRGLTLSVSDAK